MTHPVLRPVHGSDVRRPRLLMAAACALALFFAMGTATAQEAAQLTWSKVEASEDSKKFQEQLKKGEFDAASKAFLERVALPQLAAEGNRKQIERIRRRMRDVLLNGRTAEPTAFEQVAQAAVDWLTAQARNPQVEPVVAVNAMLLAGEIRGKDDRAWAGSAAALAAAMADAKLLPAVRVAAAAGLAKHVDAARAATGADAALAQAAAKPVLAVVATPVPPAAGAAGDWLLARALDMLPTLVPKASAETAAAIQAVMLDASRPLDVRVRAAAALGATATPESKVDADAAAAAIQGLAIAALEADVEAAAERAMKARMSGQPMTSMGGRGFDGGAPPGFTDTAFSGEFGNAGGAATVEDPIDTLVIRRDAWRLMTLANALASPDGTSGLASLATAAAAPRVRAAADALRQSAQALDQTPDAAVVKQTLADLQRLARPAAAAGAASGSGPAATPQPAVQQPAAGDPFGAGN